MESLKRPATEPGNGETNDAKMPRHEFDSTADPMTCNPLREPLSPAAGDIMYVGSKVFTPP